MSDYDFTPQRVQRAFEEISSRFRDEKVKIETGARLIKTGIVTTEDWNKMNKRAMEMYIEENKAKKKDQKEQEERHAQDLKPDVRIPKLAASMGTQPERFSNYIQTYEKPEEIVMYLGDLKTRPLHYHSIFHGKLLEVIQFLELELTKRDVKLEKNKDKAKPKNYIK